MRLSLRTGGRAGADLAWGRYADVGAWRTWSPQIDAVTTDGGGRALAAGLTGVVTGLPLAGRALLAVRFTIEDVDGAATTWAWRVRPTRVVADLPAWAGRSDRSSLVPGDVRAPRHPCPAGTSGRSACTPGAGQNPPVLSGRSHELATVETTLTRLGDGRSAQCQLVVGRRGVGRCCSTSSPVAPPTAAGSSSSTSCDRLATCSPR